MEEPKKNQTINSREHPKEYEFYEYSKVELDDVKPNDYRFSSTIKTSKSFTVFDVV